MLRVVTLNSFNKHYRYRYNECDPTLVTVSYLDKTCNREDP